MADNPTGPATAPVSGGSPATAGAAAPAAEPSLKEVLESVKALRTGFESEKTARENLRSLHDRQMTELRNLVVGGKAGGTARQGDEGGEPAAQPATGGARSISARELAMQRDNAILRFRQDHPDWQEYWADIETIGSDAAKSRRFVRYAVDPDSGELTPDFYSSLVDIREHLELQRHRAAKAATDPATQQANRNNAQARADAATIGGAAASIPTDALGPDFQKLPYNEKIKRLYAAGLLDIDPNDPPEALRGV